MTNIGLATAIAATPMLRGVIFAAQKDETFTGEITDNQCVKMGSHQAMMKSMNMNSQGMCPRLREGRR